MLEFYEQQECVFRQTCADDASCEKQQTSSRNYGAARIFAGSRCRVDLQGGVVLEHGLPAASAKALHTHSSTSAHPIFDHGWACAGLTGQLEMHCLGARPVWEPADVLLGNRQRFSNP